MITSPTDLSQQHPCLKLYTSHYQGVFGDFHPIGCAHVGRTRKGTP